MRENGTLKNENRIILLRLHQNEKSPRNLVSPHFFFKALDGLEINHKRVVRKGPLTNRKSTLLLTLYSHTWYHTGGSNCISST
jgi:hypothetical protein